jgi:oligosaccharide repeat unit polymerase
MAMVAFAWLYERTVGRIPRLVILMFIASMTVLLPLLAVARNSVASRSDIVGTAQKTLSEKNPVVALLSEMGGTLATVAYAEQFVPDTRDYDYGASYAYAFSTVFPNFGSGVHPAVAHGLLAKWLIDTADPYIADRGGTLGFSFIAEAYVNFGWAGVVIIPAVFGCFMVFLTNWGESDRDPAKLAVVATFLTTILMLPRGESQNYIRGLIWYALIPYLWVHFLTANRARRAIFHRTNAYPMLSVSDRVLTAE